MEVKRAKLGVATYLTPDGALIEENLPSLSEAVQQVRDSGSANLVIDLKRVQFFDSRGLEYLLDLAHELGQGGGTLRLVGASPLCKDVLAITRIDQTVSVYDDIESAGRSFL